MTAGDALTRRHGNGDAASSHQQEWPSSPYSVNTRRPALSCSVRI